MLDETEAPRWLLDALGSLPGDDAPIPGDVARRLDVLLTELAAQPRESAAAEPIATYAESTPAAATVAPITAARSRRSLIAHRGLLTAVAAAAALVFAGLTFTALTRTPQPTAVTAADAELPESSQQTAVVSSGREYSETTLPDNTRTLLAATSSVTGYRVSDAVTAAEQDALTGPSTSQPTDDCIAELTGDPAVRPLVVDEAKYGKASVFVVILATPVNQFGEESPSAQSSDPAQSTSPEASPAASAQAATVDVWVVRRDCSAADPGLVKFVRVTP